MNIHEDAYEWCQTCIVALSQRKAFQRRKIHVCPVVEARSRSRPGPGHSVTETAFEIYRLNPSCTSCWLLHLHRLYVAGPANLEHSKLWRMASTTTVTQAGATTTLITGGGTFHDDDSTIVAASSVVGFILVCFTPLPQGRVLPS